MENNAVSANTDSASPSSHHGTNANSDDLLTGSDHDAGRTDPFDRSALDTVSTLLAQHGPALAKLLLIAGSATGTIYNAIKAGSHPQVLNGGLLIAILISAGLIVECGFAYAWSRKGSHDLAGLQRKTVDAIFHRSSYVMIGDLSLSVAEVAFGIGNVAIYWIGLVQPFCAVHIVKLFYELKGQHPEYIAEMEIVDMRADMKAAELRDEAETQRLNLAERNHERQLQWASLRERHQAGSKLVSSRWFRRQTSKAVKDAVGKKLLQDIRKRVGKLPSLLRLPYARRN